MGDTLPAAGNVKTKSALFESFIKTHMQVDPQAIRSRVAVPSMAPLLAGASAAPLDAPVAAETGPGLESLPLGAKYGGEEKGEGWRVGQTKAGLQMKTKHFDETERTASTVDFGADGKATRRDGMKMEGQTGFVMDPKSGDLHQFKEAGVVEGTDYVATHHSTPLAGGDVAGAGRVTVVNDRIVNINDQSGHYKPKAEFTFQAVRQINLATMTADIQAKLRKRASGMGEGGDGKPESPDTMEQLVAAEVGVARDEYFAKLDAEQKAMHATAADLPEAEQDAAFEAVAAARHEAVTAFRNTAAAVEKSLRKGDAPSPLMSGSESVGKNGKKSPNNREAKVSLLGKAGALSDSEYDPLKAQYSDVMLEPASTDSEKAAALDTMKADFNRASALKQLQAPMGEEAFAKLLKTKAGSGGSAIAQAMTAYQLEPGKEDSVARLKALLGQEAVDAIKGDDTAVAKLVTQYGVTAISHGTEWGAEASAFEVGKSTSTTLSAQQFLQTGGNEAQIRSKSRMTAEIQPDSRKRGPQVSLKRQDDSPMHAELGGPDVHAARRFEIENDVADLDSAMSQKKADMEYFEGSSAYKAEFEAAKKEFDAAVQKKALLLQEHAALPANKQASEVRKSEIQDHLDELEGVLVQKEADIDYFGGDDNYKEELAKAKIDFQEATNKKEGLIKELQAMR